MFMFYIGFFIVIISVITRFDDIMFLIYTTLTSDIFGLEEVKKTTLLVGVMSAQHNFKAREMIRDTWGQLMVNRSIDLKFLVGDEICPYPFKDRVTPYSCDLWLINQPKAMEEYSTMGSPMENRRCDIGFTFLVKTGLIVDRIGLDSQIFKRNSTAKARVVLYDNRKGMRVASATFVKEPFNGILWKSIVPIVLNEGFEGEIEVVGEGLDFSRCLHRLEYIAPIHYFETIKSDGNFADFKLGDWHTIPVGFNYTLIDSRLEELLADRTERFRRWRVETTVIKKRLEDEQDKYKDIIFLSGFPDVYDNLSFKLMAFFKWVKMFDRWKYVLKTDDDVFLDLAVIEKGLQNEMDLWTCLRSVAPNRSGKWRDRRSERYPPFPSGSGYVLAASAIRKLNLAPKRKLGEDVMVGYAIKNLKKPFNETCFWACGPVRGNSPACNVPELSTTQMVAVWDLYKEFGYIPDDDEL